MTRTLTSLRPPSQASSIINASMSRITMDNYELDTFSPAHRLSPNRRLAASSPIQCHEDYTYIQVPHSVTDTCESDTLSLSPNRGPPSVSVPLLDSRQSQMTTNRWNSDDHRTSKHKRQVTRSLVERLLGVAKLSALFILPSAYLGFCVLAQKHLISLKSNKYYSFTPDHIGWSFSLGTSL